MKDKYNNVSTTLKGYIPYDSIYMTFLKSQKDRDGKQIRGGWNMKVEEKLATRGHN